MKETVAKAKEGVKNAVENIIAKLPENQQEVVRTCISLSGVPAKQRRYSLEWIYTCILIRIRSKSLYGHMRELDMMPLPTRNTLNSYLQKVEATYGFQPADFECLMLKGSRMEENKKHGTRKVYDFHPL